MEFALPVVAFAVAVLAMLLFIGLSVVNISEQIAHGLRVPVEGIDYRHRYETLDRQLREVLEESKELKTEWTEHGLAFSAVEAEGYLRCALTIECLLDEIKE